MPLPHNLRRLELSSPSFGLFLLAIAALPFRWLSPLGSLNERGGWSDILVAAAIGAWLWEKRHRRWQAIRGSLRPWHAGLAGYVILVGVSAARSRDAGAAASQVLLVAELAFLALLAADFGSLRSGRRGIAWAVIVGALATGVLAAVALSLFYVGVHTSLTGAYGQLVASDRFARVRAGFYSAPLMASYCIFASAVLAMDESPLKGRSRLLAQVALGAMTLVTVSRGFLGFLAAAVVRAARRVGTRRWRLFAIAGVSAALLAMAALSAVHVSGDPTRPASLKFEAGKRSGRYDAFVTSLRTTWRHPVFGIGPGLLPGEYRYRGTKVRAHCTPVNIAGTVGIPALCALAFVVAWAWRRRYRPTDIAIWSGLLGVAIDGLGQDIDHFRHVWILLGLALARAGQTREPPAGHA